MECNDARLLLNFARPLASELEESEAEALASHLNRCPRCADIDRAGRRLDDHIGRAMRDVPVPPDLGLRLKARLDRDRDNWYRRRLIRSSAVAAGLFLAMFLGWNALHTRPDNVDIARLHEQANQVEKLDQPRKVEEWFQSEHKVAMKAPTAFDYNLLSQCSLVDFQGKQVPRLQFQKSNPGAGDSVAWVYVLSDKQFDLKSLEGKTAPSVGAFKVAWERDSSDPHIAYVVVYTGDLAVFKKVTKQI